MKKTKLVTMLLALSMSAMLGSGCQLLDKFVSNESSDSITSEQSSLETSDSSSTAQASVTLDQTTSSIGLFDTLTLKATVAGSNASVTWSSSNENVATVSKGVVTPVSAGTAEIIATAGEMSAKCTVTVTAPTEAIEIVVAYESLKLETGKTEKLSPVGYLGVKELTEGVYTYSSTDPSIATVAEDGTITAVKAGEVTIKVNGTFKGIAATELSLSVSVSDPITHEAETIAGKIKYYANREEKLSIDLSAYDFTEIQSFMIDEKAYAFTMTEKTLNVEKTILSDVEGGEKEILIVGLTETGDVTIGAKMLYVNYAIGSVDEWNEFGAACNLEGTTQTPYIYAILTADIDYQGGHFSDVWSAGGFNGYFDGQGYTVGNLTVTNSVFPNISGTATRGSVVKNVAFVNVGKTTPNGGGLLTNWLNEAEIDNVYVQGTVSAYTGTACGAVANYTSGMTTVKNSVFVVDFASNPGKFPALIASGNVETNVKIDNVSIISANSNGKIVGNDKATVVNTVLYASVADFKVAVTALPAGFDANLWEINAHGMLVFKNVAKYASTPSVTLTMGATGTDAIIGSPLTFTVDNAKATVVIEGENTEGITIGGTSVNIADTVAPGTNFKVVAYAYDLISGEVAKSESVEYTVVTAENVTLEGMQKAAKNRNETLTFDVSDYNIEELGSVSIGGVTVTAENYTYENGSITVKVTSLSVSGTQEVSIIGLKENGYVFVKANVTIYDYAIGDVDELNAFGAKCNEAGGTRQTAYMYVVLTDNIDYNNGVFTEVYSGGYFNGCFDGQGYTISNVRVINSFFVGVEGTSSQLAEVKNVAFVNIVKHTGNGGGLMANHLGYTVVDNVYINGRVELYTNPAACGALCNDAVSTTVKNSLIVVDYASVSGTMPMLMGSCDANTTVDNVSIISSNAGSNFITTNRGSVTNTVLYKSYEDFKAAVTAVPEGFDAALWEIKDGMLVFSSALNFAMKEVVIEVDGEGTEIVCGASATFTATAGATVKAVGDDVEGITVNGNTVTVASSVTGGTKFKLVATLFDTITGKTYTAESEELTVASSETVTIEEELIAAKNRSGNLEIDLSEYSVTEITSVTADGTAVNEYTLTEGKLTVAASLLAYGQQTVSVVAKTETGYLSVTAKAYVVDYAIGTVAEWNAFGAACNLEGTTQMSTYVYAILTANIDYNNGHFTDVYSGGCFNGSLDGRGYAISNLTVTNSVFPNIRGTSTKVSVIKNVAFVNVIKTTPNGGGLLTNWLNEGLIDNVYVSGAVLAYAGAGGGTVANYVNGTATVQNSVFVANFVSNAGVAPAILQSGNAVPNVKINNVSVVSASTSGKMVGNNLATVTNSAIYESGAAFKAAVTAVPAGFDTNYWEMKDGLLVFKNAVGYTVTEVQLKVEGEDVEVAVGGALNFTATVGATVKVVGDNVEGITINGNTVTVASSVTGGTKFKLVATLFDQLNDKTYTAESAEYTVITSEILTIEEELIAAKNRSGNLEIDLSEYSVTEITSVTADGTAVNEYTLTEGKLTVAASLLAYGQQTVSVVAKTETGYLSVTAKAYVVDYAIGTVAEWNAFGAACNLEGTTQMPTYVYAILTANIDYNNGHFTDVYSGGCFNGSLDGRGYAISNLTVTNSVFPNIRGTSTKVSVIKNVAFVNVGKTTPNGGGLLTNWLNEALIDNVYVSGTVSAYTGAGCGAVANYTGGMTTVQNSVFVVNFVSNAGSASAVIASGNAASNVKIDNVSVISANSNGKLVGNNLVTVTNSAIYESEAAFKAAVTAVPAGFDTNYWEMKDGLLVFKNAVTTASEDA